MINKELDDIFGGTETEKNKLYGEIKGLRDKGISWNDCVEKMNKPKSTLRDILNRGVREGVRKTAESVREGVRKTAESVRNVPKASTNDDFTHKEDLKAEVLSEILPKIREEMANNSPVDVSKDDLEGFKQEVLSGFNEKTSEIMTEFKKKDKLINDLYLCLDVVNKHLYAINKLDDKDSYAIHLKVMELKGVGVNE